MNISTQSSCASLWMIYTWERTSAQRDASLLLLWRRSDGQEQGISFSGTLKMGMKTSSSQIRNFSPLRSSVTTRTTRFMLICPLRCILRVQGCHHPPCVMVWWEVSHQGVTHLHFRMKGVKLVSEYIKRPCYKELWNSLTWPSSVVRNGSSIRTQFLPKSQDNSGVAAEVRSCLYQHQGLAFSESDLNPWDYKLWAVLEDMACQKHHNNLDSLKRSLVKAAAEIPLETVHTAIAKWPEHLKACIEAEGDHFELNYYK